MATTGKFDPVRGVRVTPPKTAHSVRTNCADRRCAAQLVSPFNSEAHALSWLYRGGLGKRLARVLGHFRDAEGKFRGGLRFFKPLSEIGCGQSVKRAAAMRVGLARDIVDRSAGGIECPQALRL